MFYVSCSMISKEEVKHIAKLARLGLSDKEIQKFQKELSSILDYMKKLNEVNVSRVAPTSHPFELENVVRLDKGEKLDPKIKKALLGQAPKTKDGYLKVKSVL